MVELPSSTAGCLLDLCLCVAEMHVKFLLKDLLYRAAAQTLAQILASHGQHNKKAYFQVT